MGATIGVGLWRWGDFLALGREGDCASRGANTAQEHDAISVAEDFWFAYRGVGVVAGDKV